mgnify:CR=1 FL=1
MQSKGGARREAGTFGRQWSRWQNDGGAGAYEYNRPAPFS